MWVSQNRVLWASPTSCMKRQKWACLRSPLILCIPRISILAFALFIWTIIFLIWSPRPVPQLSQLPRLPLPYPLSCLKQDFWLNCKQISLYGNGKTEHQPAKGFMETLIEMQGQGNRWEKKDKVSSSFSSFEERVLLVPWWLLYEEKKKGKGANALCRGQCQG